MTGLMAGRRGLIIGVANNHSIAWGIAKALHAQGAHLAFTYQGEALGRRVSPLAASLGSDIVLPCDVEDLASVDAVFTVLDERFEGGLDFLVHAVGFSDKAQLKGRYVDVTTRENFSRTMTISCFSFTEIAQRAAKRMRPGGALLTLTYAAPPGHAELQRDGRGQGSAGSLRALPRRRSRAGRHPGQRALCGAGAHVGGCRIADARLMFNHQKAHAPLRRTVSLEEIGGSALYLLSDPLRRRHGEVHFVDSGYNIISIAAARRASGAGRGRPARRRLNRLEVEITETALVQDLEATRVILTSLPNLGVRIALDDFGTGYSSLYHLRELRFDKAKIDRSYVDSITMSEERAKLVDAIIKLARAWA